MVLMEKVQEQLQQRREEGEIREERLRGRHGEAEEGKREEGGRRNEGQLYALAAKALGK